MALACPSVCPDCIFLNLREDLNSTQVGMNLVSPHSFYAFYEVEITRFSRDFAKIR